MDFINVDTRLMASSDPVRAVQFANQVLDAFLRALHGEATYVTTDGVMTAVITSREAALAIQGKDLAGW